MFIKLGYYFYREQLINESKEKLKDEIYFDAVPHQVTTSMSICINANKRISLPSPQKTPFVRIQRKFRSELLISSCLQKMIISFEAFYVGNELY